MPYGDPIDWPVVLGNPSVITCPSCLGSGWNAERVACFECEGHGHNGPRTVFDGVHGKGFMTFDSRLDYPEHARALVRKRLKEDGIDMADHAIDAFICEFLMGMKEIGYRSIELNSVPVVY